VVKVRKTSLDGGVNFKCARLKTAKYGYISVQSTLKLNGRSRDRGKKESEMKDDLYIWI